MLCCSSSTSRRSEARRSGPAKSSTSSTVTQPSSRASRKAAAGDSDARDPRRTRSTRMTQSSGSRRARSTDSNSPRLKSRIERAVRSRNSSPASRIVIVSDDAAWTSPCLVERPQHRDRRGGLLRRRRSVSAETRSLCDPPAARAASEIVTVSVKGSEALAMVAADPARRELASRIPA